MKPPVRRKKTHPGQWYVKSQEITKNIEEQIVDLYGMKGVDARIMWLLLDQIALRCTTLQDNINKGHCKNGTKKI